MNSTVATSAAPIGRPGWPDLACSTASMARTRTAFARSEWVTRSAGAVSGTAGDPQVLRAPQRGGLSGKRRGLLNTRPGRVKGTRRLNSLKRGLIMTAGSLQTQAPSPSPLWGGIKGGGVGAGASIGYRSHPHLQLLPTRGRRASRRADSLMSQTRRAVAWAPLGGILAPARPDRKPGPLFRTMR